MMVLRFTSQMCLIVLVLLFSVRLNTINCCHETDKSLLLIFKDGVVDPSNRLSSWSPLQDCCYWEGVVCDDSTSRVSGLDLSSVYNNSESLRGEINLSSLLSIQFLESLSLEYNDFERISMPSINNSHLLITNSSSKLSTLSLSYNIHLHIDNLHHLLSLLPSLTNLYLNGIHLPSDTNWVQSLATLPLEALDLSDCNLTTSSFLPLEYANFSSLYNLDLSLNDFSYGLPNWLFNLSNDHLFYLLLSRCNLRGQIPYFSGYRNLRLLDLSSNKLKGSIPDWLGQLDRLSILRLSNNSFHGSIPLNLANSSSHLTILDISFNDLREAHPKILEHQYWTMLDLSHNSISGDISKLILNSGSPYLSFNKFEGHLPRISDDVVFLDLAYNSFSGSLSSLLCPNDTKSYSLFYLDISNNFLTQELPDCWSNWAELSHIYLGSNKLFGEISPIMASSLHNLMSLDLHDNSFYGYIPWTFKNCTSLVLLNLEGNNFSGNIPKWLPQSVSILKLRSNQFTGDIPTELCSLSNLTLLDLANNRLSGFIPPCLYNITLMVSEMTAGFLYLDLMAHGSPGSKSTYVFRSGVHTKGQELGYDKYLKLVRSIDLSANELCGEIPSHLFKLIKLQSLNLSYNFLRGEIPEQIGEMKALESLDFSHNNLQGNIPPSMSGLSFLGDLNMSYNNFSGQIPLGTQLQSFDEWSYIGNPELCGPPLKKNCTKPNKTELVTGNDDDDDGFLKSLYLGMGVGFPVGFWLVCGSLFLNREWRHMYFRFFDGVFDRIYVIVAIKLQRFR